MCSSMPPHTDSYFHPCLHPIAFSVTLWGSSAGATHRKLFNDGWGEKGGGRMRRMIAHMRYFPAVKIDSFCTSDTSTLNTYYSNFIAIGSYIRKSTGRFNIGFPALISSRVESILWIVQGPPRRPTINLFLSSPVYIVQCTLIGLNAYLYFPIILSILFVYVQ